MNYWHIQLNPDKSLGYDKIREILSKTSYIGLTLGDKNQSDVRFFNQVMIKGDIVLVRDGQTPVALVQVIGDVEHEENPNQELDWFQERRKVEVLEYADSKMEKFPQTRGTLERLINDTDSLDYIKKWLSKIKGEKQMTDVIKLLESNKQIILTGAPGTGKTYLAMEIAVKMIGCNFETLDKNEHEQYEFVQFHPNYDYSDFVEGLKPDIVNEQIKFKLVTGIFKKFCQCAQEAYNKAPKEDGENEKKNAPKFAFVIDEINRADLSRVFGELFFGLEADYRGKPIKMQYSYLYDEKDKPFSIPPNVYIIGTMNDIDRSVESMDFALRRRFAWKEISAKESEHIIDKAKISDDLKKKAKERMGKLNDKIKEIMGSASYQIGGAYFKKLENYKDDQNAFENLWNNHLKILLNEYLRGESDAEKKLADLKIAYDVSQ